MALATTCPQCKTSFKVVPDQLKLRRGLVRCGVCQHVFSGIDFLRHVDDTARAAARQARTADAAAGAPPEAGPHVPPGGTRTPAPPTEIRTPATEAGRSPGDVLPALRADEPHETGYRAAGTRLRTESSASHAPPASFASPETPAPRVPEDPDEGLKTAFFLTDSAFGPLPGDEDADDSPAGPPARGAPAADPAGPDVPKRPPAYASLPVLPFTDEPPPVAAAIPAPAPAPAPPVSPPPEPPASEIGPGPRAAPVPDPGLPALPLRPERSANLPERAVARAVLEPDALSRHGPGTLLAPDASTRQGPRTRLGGDPDTVQGPGTSIVPTPRDRLAPKARLGADAPTRHGPRTLLGPDDPVRHGPGTLLGPDQTGRYGPGTLLGPDEPSRYGPRTRYGADDGSPRRGTGTRRLPDDPARHEPRIRAAADLTVPPRRPFPDPRLPTEASPREDLAAPAIDYFASGQRRSRSLGLALSPVAWGAVAILSVLLALQAVVGWRDAIAARAPALAPLLSATLEPFGWSIGPPRELGALTIESFELQAAESPNRLRMFGVLRNRGNHAVGFPAIELTLTDSAGALLVRKVITAEVYLGTAADTLLPGGVPPRSERPIRLVLEHGGLQPTGFSVALFHP